MAKKTSAEFTQSIRISKSDLQKEIAKVTEEVRLRDIFNTHIKRSQALQENLLAVARTWDIRIKIGIRIVLILFFMSLLTIQNFMVFKFLTIAFNKDTIDKIQPTLSIVISGTLTETYFVIRKIVDWAMKDIDYTIKK